MEKAGGLYTLPITAESFMRARFIILFVLATGSHMHFIPQNASSDVSHPGKQAELANIALKQQIGLGEVNKSEITALLSTQQYDAIESAYVTLYRHFKRDVRYERSLRQAYMLFAPREGISIEDLDLWVATTASDVAYAARGAYKARLGFDVRGGKTIDKTPRQRIEDMHRYHTDAFKDLQMAIEKNPGLMPAYVDLIWISTASSIPITPREALDMAIHHDNRTYYARRAYVDVLHPKWGGSFRQMSDFAKGSLKYIHLNPRLWSLQGMAYAYRAMDYDEEADYTNAISMYSAALAFGDDVTLLKNRAAVYYKSGNIGKAEADYRRVLYYHPTDSTAVAFSLPGGLDRLKYDLRESTYVSPSICEMHIKRYAIVTVEHGVDWLKKRPDGGRVVIYNNIAKIERMLEGLGFAYVERSKVVAIAGTEGRSVSATNPRYLQEVGRKSGADAVIVATIPAMGRDHSKGVYFEDIKIKALSVATGAVAWESKLEGTVPAKQEEYEHTLLLDSIERKLYNLLERILRTRIACKRVEGP
ncbi:MAG: tetratricopeptide repeat protein [Nitrospirae bacterium]|nr:tetratricopeptide repeat protein [Nitrospirota bacterium]